MINVKSAINSWYYILELKLKHNFVPIKFFLHVFILIRLRLAQDYEELLNYAALIMILNVGNVYLATTWFYCSLNGV